MLPVVAIVGAGAFFGVMRGDAAGLVAMGGSLLLAWLVAMALSIPLYMALWFAPALVVLRGRRPRRGDQGELSGLPEEHRCRS